MIPLQKIVGDYVVACSAVAVGTAFVVSCALYSWTASGRVKVKKPKKKKPAKPVEEPLWALRKKDELDLPLPHVSSDKLAQLNKRKPPENWKTVIFFPDLLQNRPDAPIKRLRQMFKEAKTSIHLCLYLCSLFEMSETIKKKFQEGLIVMVITDYDTWTAHNNSGLKNLARAGMIVLILNYVWDLNKLH